MKVNIFNSKIKINESNAIHLDETDFHPCAPFFLNHDNLLPESADVVAIKGILERTLYIRYILKIADALLKISGKLEIDFYTTSFDNGSNPLRVYATLMYDLSISYKQRFKLIRNEKNGDVYNLVFEKIESTLPVDDSIDSWSFGIVSDGRKNDRILNVIKQIELFSIPNFEIIICGPPPSHDLPVFVKVFDDSDLYFDSRIPISKKKNRIIENAKYNNLLLFHDRFSFPLDWYENMRKHGNYFDCLAVKILDEATQTHRVQDWIGTSLDHYDFLKINPKNYNLNYNQWIPNWNVNGGFMIIKKHLIERVKLNPFLHWGECEDGDLCRRLDADGLCLTLFTGTYVLTQTHRLNVQKTENTLVKLVQNIIGKIHWYWSFYHRIFAFRKYLELQKN